jgi:hypothetical protein
LIGIAIAIKIWKSLIDFKCGNYKAAPASGDQNTLSMKTGIQTVVLRRVKTALPFDLMCYTLAFLELRHWILSIIVFTAPRITLRLA